MEMRGLMGGLYRISEWIMRLSFINILWLVFSLPFVIISFMQVLVMGTMDEPPLRNVYDLISWMLIPLVLAPFTIFPATSAMFAVARKWVMGDEDVPLFRTFFQNYKSTYKKAMIGGLVLCFMLVVILVNLQFYSEQTSFLAGLRYLFIALLAILAATIINFMAFLSHFEMKLLMLLRNSVFFTIGRPLTSLYLLVSCGAIVYFSFFRFQFLIPFFMGSLMAVCSFWGFYRVVRKIQERAQQEAEQAEGNSDVNN